MTGCNWKLSKVANAVNGTLIGNDREIEGVTTDTRKISDGQLFVALKGPNFDAHDFVSAAVDAGAAGLLVERQLDISAPQVIVENCLKSLGRLATAWRQQHDIPVVAVTGSNGKTTVKEMLAAIFRQRGDTLATIGNLNNDIGVPLTLLRISESDQAAIIEMGANHVNEIAYLTQLAKPSVALINNAASAHLEGFGSLDSVAQAKGEIFLGLSDEGVAIINADDDYADYWRTLAHKNSIVSFGIKNKASVYCQQQSVTADNKLEILTPKAKMEVTLRLLGKHNVMNALAATASALAANVDIKDIVAGLEQVRPVAGRLETKPGVNGATIIDDTYNANPNSLNAAMDVLVQFSGEKILVLGDMGELGGNASELHQQSGESARNKGIDHLYAVGNLSKYAVNAFGSNAKHFEDKVTMNTELKKILHPNAIILVKGSRSMRMDEVVDALCQVGGNN